MNFVQFHVGDWDSSTRLLSPLEKGIYIDLLFLYYSLERPLMRSECERISRAYTPEEKRALEYVLERFFMVEGDSYRHLRCDKEIEATRSKSAKAAASAKARWNRAKANIPCIHSEEEQLHEECEMDANASETHIRDASERNADGMLTDNRKPITITTEEKVEKEAKKSKREPTVSFPDSLPAEWRQAALSIRQDVTPERVFLKLRGRFAPTTSKKTIGNWRKMFLDWVGREYPETGRASSASKGSLPPHKDPAFHFGKEYYDKSVNPDGTTNWGV
jgi:uncharacterized protein YdaU (DUF1376 family)